MVFGNAVIYYRTGSGVRTGRLARDPVTKRLLVDRACPDANPCNVLCSLTGTTLCTGCITGGQVPSSPAAWSAQWDSGATNFDITFCMGKLGFPTDAPPAVPSGLVSQFCCTWRIDATQQYCAIGANHCLNVYLPIPLPPLYPPIWTPNAACNGSPPFAPKADAEGCYAYLWRSGSPADTWNFALTLFDPAIPSGGTAWIGPIFTGSVVSANCMDPFTITNSISGCTGGILLDGGTASFTPGGC